MATITTDTGAFAPGRKDFARYDTPALCLGAANMARRTFRNGFPTIHDDSVGLGAAAQVARRCGARFTLANTLPADRRLLYELALYSQRDSLAEAVAMALLAPANASPIGAQDPVDQEVLRGELVRLALDDGRPAVVDAMLERLKHGSVAEQDSLAELLRVSMLRDDHLNWDGTKWAAHIGQAKIHEVAEQIITLATLPARRTNAVAFNQALEAYQALMEEAAFQSHDSMVAVARRAQHDLALYSRQARRCFMGDCWYGGVADWATAPLDTVIAHVSPVYMSMQQMLEHIKAPRLTADYWFPAPGQPASDTVWPVPGKINLLCSGGDTRSDPGASDAQQAADIRRWLKTYGPGGLVVALVRPAGGHDYWGGGDYSFGSEKWHLGDEISQQQVMAPAAEAQAWRWLEQDYLHLPVAVAVQARHSTFLPEPDGRRWTETRLAWNRFFWPRQATDYCVTSDTVNNTMNRGSGSHSGCNLTPDDTLLQEGQNDKQNLHRTVYRPGEIHYACVVIDRAGQLLYQRQYGMGDDATDNVDRVLRWVFAGDHTISR